MPFSLHVISNGKDNPDIIVDKVRRISPYTDYIHLREKEKSAHQLMEILTALQVSGVPADKLIINDRVDVALAANVRGVQLGHHSIEPAIVKKQFPQLYLGHSIHSNEEAEKLSFADADYLLYGHIYASHSKEGIPPRGLHSLREVAAVSTLPIIAIGGILPSHIAELKEAGAQGAAVLSGIWDAENIEMSCKAYRKECY